MNPGIHAAISAALAADEARKQEEDHTMRYRPEDLAGDWEFKIVRSYSPIFRKPENLQQIREEEALSGWSLLEKLDDFRVRFKRPASAAKRDARLPAEIDPYRTQLRGGTSNLARFFMFGIALLSGVTIFILAKLTLAEDPSLASSPFILIAIVTFLVILIPIAALFVRARR